MSSSRIRISLLSLLAVLAFSAVAATGAQAFVHEDHGPFYEIAGARLLGGNTAKIVSSTSEPTTEPWVLTAGTVTITCTTSADTGVLIGSGDGLLGVKDETGSTNEETVEFTGCTVTGNGTPCSVVEPIKTELLESLVGYENNTGDVGAGQILTLLRPKPTNTHPSLLATVHFTGTGCGVTEIKVEVKAGCSPACEGIIADNETEADVSIKVDAEPAQAKIWDLTFPGTELKTIYTEKEGVLTKRHGGIAAVGAAAKLTGSADVELESGGEWRVSTGT